MASATEGVASSDAATAQRKTATEILPDIENLPKFRDLWYYGFMSRCIRLEVSQRLPPRAWTWA